MYNSRKMCLKHEFQFPFQESILHFDKLFNKATKKALLKYIHVRHSELNELASDCKRTKVTSRNSHASLRFITVDSKRSLL